MKTNETGEDIYGSKLITTIDKNMELLSAGYNLSEERKELKVESIKSGDEEQKGTGTSNFELKSELKQQLSTFEKPLPSSLCSLAAGICFTFRSNLLIFSPNVSALFDV